MLALIFGLAVRVVVIAAKTVKRVRAEKPKSVCNECVFSHVQYGACGGRAISCTFGGGVRPMTLDVLYCTDYRTRSAPVPIRPAIGFVYEIAPAE